MRIKRFILLLLSVFVAWCSSGQLAGEYMQSRILILLDGSSSMTQKWAGGKVKYTAAEDLIMALMDSVYAINNQVQFGLRVFGHQSTVPENNCYDTRSEVAFSTDNRSQMYLRLQDIHPLGVTPIAFALKEAANKDILDEEHYAYSIILITDGGESCGGDICEVMKTLVKSKVYFKPYIVSLENDPALKTTYACMGDFLQVTSDNELPPAIKTILDALRPAIKIKKTDYSVMQTITARAPKKWAPSTDNLSTISESGLKLFSTPLPTDIKLRSKEPTAKIPKVKIDTTGQPRPVNVAALTSLHMKAFATTITAIKLNKINGPFELPKVKIDTPKTDKITRLAPAPLSRFNILFAMDERTKPISKLPPLPPVKVDKFIQATEPEPKKHEFKTEVTDDKETSLEVYFTNGAGTYYTSTPQVLLLDPITKQPLKKFYRTVDASGNPDPQTDVAPGLYELTFVDKRDFVLSGVRVQANKKNKIIVKVTTASLSFAYLDVNGAKPVSRPVTEFSAMVTQRNKQQGRVQLQPGTEKMQYEPGNYHIEINTYPMDIRNVDLLFDGETVIGIPQPGFAKFAGDGKTRTVEIWNRNGERFVRLTSLSLGDARSQHMQLQPGEYQVHYQKGPGQGNASEKVKTFRIKPTEETTIDLD